MPVPPMIRTRWAAIGAAVAVSLGAGGVGLLHATVPSGAAAFVPITPCRLFDTRPAPHTVGTRTTPLTPDEIYDISGRGTQGNCVLPDAAVGLVLNVTAVDASQATFLTLFPTGAERPTASHLNPSPGAPPAPNAVTVDLSASGQFSVFNRFGNVHVLADVVGYYTDHHHDDRYYTEAEVDAAVAAATGDKADAADVYTQAETDAAIAAATGPSSHSITLGPSAFQPFNGLMVVQRSGSGAWIGDDANVVGVATLRAPLSLPVGSTITGLTYHYLDDDATIMSIVLAQHLINDLSDSTVPGTEVVTSDGTEPQSTTLSGLSIPVTATGALAIDASAGAAQWESAGASLTIKGVVVTYTLPG
jgi:hypothetical protein